MPTTADHSPITWQLRQVMAVAGMFHTTDLITTTGSRVCTCPASRSIAS